MALIRYKLYNGSNRYKLKSPSFSGKGSFVLGVALTVTENVSAHKDVTCFDGADGSITVAASGGTAPYVYSLDQNFTTTNSTGVFSGLSVSGTVYESTDQYGGIVVCHKTIYAKDANGRIGHVDVELKSPVELEWLGVQDLTFYVPDGETEIVLCYGVDFPVPYLSTTSNNAEIRNPHGTGYPTNYEIIDGRWYYHFLVNRTYDIVYEARNDCRRGVNCYFTITVLPN